MATFLSFGGNEARKRYEKLLLASATKNIKPTGVQQDIAGGKKTNVTNTSPKTVTGNGSILMPDPTLLEPLNARYVILLF